MPGPGSKRYVSHRSCYYVGIDPYIERIMSRPDLVDKLGKSRTYNDPFSFGGISRPDGTTGRVSKLNDRVGGALLQAYKWTNRGVSIVGLQCDDLDFTSRSALENQGVVVIIPPKWDTETNAWKEPSNVDRCFLILSHELQKFGPPVTPAALSGWDRDYMCSLPLDKIGKALLAWPSTTPAHGPLLAATHPCLLAHIPAC